MAWNQRMRSGWMGAAAVMRMWAWSRPNSWRIFAPTTASSASYGSFSHTGACVHRVVLGHHVLAQLDVAVDDELLEAVLVAQLRQRRLLELLPDAGHREEHRRTAVAQVLGDRRQAAGEPGLAADGRPGGSR